MSGNPGFRPADLEIDGHSNPCPGSVREPAGCRDHGSYGYSGDIEYRGGDQYDSKHRDYSAFYQLRRHVGMVSAGSNGDGPVGKQDEEGFSAERRRADIA